MLDTMLRSGVPPHIGQSPLPGSDGDVKLVFVTPNAAARMSRKVVICLRMMFGRVDPIWPSCSCRPECCRSRSPTRRRRRRRVGIDARRPLEAADRIDALDRPRGRLGLSLLPHFAAGADLARSHRLHLELHHVPRVGLPRERDLRGPLRLRLPRLQLESLVAARQHQLVALRHDADVPALPAALHGAHVGLDRVVAVVRSAEERPAPLRERERVLGELDEHLAAVEIAHRELARRVGPVRRRRGAAVLEVEGPRQVRDDADARGADDRPDGRFDEAGLRPRRWDRP